MFIAGRPSLLTSFSGLMKPDYSCEAIASSTAALDYFQEELDEDFDFNPDIRAKLSTCSALSSQSNGGLKRSISSLQSGANCSHTNPSNECIVQARQIEIDIASMSTNSFWLSIAAPNGESSGKMFFNQFLKAHRFAPRAHGCGHGNWHIEIFKRHPDGKFTKITESKPYLDGVGSLFFTVCEDYDLMLSDQQFLRLPSACHNCKKAAASAAKSGVAHFSAPSSLIRSAKFW